MKNHLFLITISPIQSFINQARKTQDLYTSSRMLSEMIRVGVEKFDVLFGKDKIIFPIFDRKEREVSLPNRFIAKIDNHNFSDDELKTKAERIELAITDKFKAFASTALSHVGEAPDGFYEQIKDKFNVFWAYEEIKTSYAEAYEKLEQQIGAIKNLRAFEQFSYTGALGEQGRKCSIDGEYNVLFYNEEDARNTFQHNPKALPIEKDAVWLGSKEGLSAVSFTKRFIEFRDGEGKLQRFASTAKIALMDDIKHLSREKSKMLVCYEKLFDKRKIAGVCAEMLTNGLVKKINLKNFGTINKHFDYQYIFEENLTAKELKNPEQLRLSKVLQQKLSKDLKTKYYALIIFDGDKMGKWLSGKFCRPNIDLEEFHRKFSECLSTFGQYARTKILHPSRDNGQTVYAGGDDFMGFVNIDCLFDVMQKLRTEFDKQINKNKAIELFKKEGKDLTFSAGIVIAHYKTPLSEVLKKARITEKVAKKKADRNAFSIAVIKSSGEIQQASYKWSNGLENWRALEEIVGLMKKDNKGESLFSNTFITNLTRELYSLAGVELKELVAIKGKEQEALNKGILKEIERLVERAKSDQLKRTSEEVIKMKTAVKKLWKNSQFNENIKHVENFIHSLHIADFLTRKIK